MRSTILLLEALVSRRGGSRRMWPLIDGARSSRPLDASAINSPDAANPERPAPCSLGSHGAREQPLERSLQKIASLKGLYDERTGRANRLRR